MSPRLQAAARRHYFHRASRRVPGMQPTRFALLLGMGVLASGMALTMPATAYAQAVRSFDVPPGGLSRALGVFGAQAGLMVAADPVLTANKSTSGLTGAYGTQEGLARLLAGTGLRAVGRGEGGYVLAPVSAEGSVSTLAPVTVTGATDSAASEGTGSYTVASTQAATKLPLSLRETPQSVTVITRQRMDDAAMVNLDDVVNDTPGLTLRRVGPERPLIYSRGFQVKSLMFDGLPTSYDGDFVASPNLAMYDRVEVVRGATGLMQGAGTPSASLNLVRKRPTQTPRLGITASAGSWENYSAELDAAGPMNSAGTLRGRGVVTYQNTNSFRSVESRENSLLYGILEADVSDRTMVTVGGYYQNANNNTSWGSLPVSGDGSDLHFKRSTFLGNDWEYWDKDTTSLFGEIDHRLGGGWKVRLAATKNWTQQADLASFITGTNGAWIQRTGLQDSTYTQDSYDIFASGPFSAFGRSHELVLGGSIRKSLSDNKGGYAPNRTNVDIFNWDPHRYPKPSVSYSYGALTETEQQSTYLTTRLNLADPLKLIVGARYDWFDMHQAFLTGDDTSYKVNANLTRYAGLIYDLDDHHSVYVSYTDIFEPQNSRDTAGNVLVPIKGKNYEIGVKGEYFGGDLNTSLALFQIDQQNRARELADQNSCPTFPANYCYEASGKVRSQGVDMEVNGALTSNWQVGAGYTYTQATYKRDANPDNVGERFDTSLPRHMLKLSTLYRFGGALERWRVGARASWQSEIYQQGMSQGRPFRVQQNGYALADAMVGYQATKNIDLQLNLRNIFDKSYYAGIAALPVGGRSVYGEPRSIMLTMRGTW
ncbi:TonB-dependent siderophore receptor [Alcaligenaceae bacterium A4P071]|nr:TonB-dependent siderophore receptor [Alcaligenaceae bacterium A4P071]